MAERKGQPSRNSKDNDEKDDENRESAENASNAPPSRDNSEHKSAQTDTTEVRHVGIQFEPHPPRDEDETQRKTYDQNLQSQMNNLGVADNQLAAGSSVFKNKGPTQFGEQNSIVKNPTYNITNPTYSIHNHYHINCQPSSHHGNNQPCHIPCQCQECIQSYVNQHMPLTEHPRHHPESESQHLGLPHHPVPQLLPRPQQTEQMEPTERRRNGTSRPETQRGSHSQQMEPQESRRNCTSRSETQFFSHSSQIESTESRGNDTPRSETQRGSLSKQIEPQESRGNNTSRLQTQRVNNSQQIESTESRENDQSKRPTEDQRSSPSQRLSPSDVIQHATRTERERAESETVNPEGGDSKKVNQSQATQNAGMRPPSVSVTHDTVSIIDSEGQVLEPGDALWTVGPGYQTSAIYVGHQMLVWCDWRTGNKMVKKEQLCMTAPFGKCRVIRKGECQVYPPRQRVDRATAWIGRKFEEGDGLDFPTWIYTGLGRFQAYWRKGFWLGYQTDLQQEGE